MRLFRQFGVLVLLLMTCFAPAMACMVSDAQMNTEERACCRMMKSQCGQMEMPASHGCCQKTPPSVHNNALETKTVTVHPITVSVVWLAVSDLTSATSPIVGWINAPTIPFRSPHPVRSPFFESS